MPYKKTIAKKTKLSPAALAYLCDEKAPESYTLWCYRHGMPGFDHEPKPEDLWRQYGDDFLQKFIEKNPGKRPLGWWHWDAPEPRQRIGGIGTLASDVLAFLPSFSYGIPTRWVTSWEAAYYNGRLKDIHGKVIPSEYKDGDFTGVAVDPDDPPLYESQAVYLDRHGLLTPAEKKYLASYPELMEPERITLTMPGDESAG